jgi:hypothetical protein
MNALTSELFSKWLRGDQEAIAFNALIYRIVETWDDLVDRDKPVSNEQINALMYEALIQLPRNGFYCRNFTLLNPIFEGAILDWFLANRMEQRRDNDDLHSAYMLRCGVQMLTVMSARIIGGIEWANQVNLEIRSMGESFADYSGGFGDKA